jgi:predicted ester cyclase
MSEAHRSLVRDFLVAYNESDWSHLSRLVGPGYVHHRGDVRLTLDQFLEGATALKAVLPDFRIVVQDVLADEDKVVARYVGGGTHQASLAGEQPTGRQVVIHGIVMFRVASGLLTEGWEVVDELGLLRAVGAVTTAP